MYYLLFTVIINRKKEGVIVQKKLFLDIMMIVLFGVLCFVTLEHMNLVMQGLQFLLSLFWPFFLGLSIAFVLNVILKKVEKWLPIKKKKIKRIIALLLTLWIVFGIVIFILFLIVPELQHAIELLIVNIPTYQEQIINWVQGLEGSKEIIEQLQSQTAAINQSIVDFVKHNSNRLLDVTVGIGTSLVSGIFNFILGLVFAIYILGEKEKYGKQTKYFLYAFLPKRQADHVICLGLFSHKIFSNFVSGQLLEAIIIGILCFIGMLVLQLPYALTISVLVGFTALIPVFGAFFGTAIGAILIFALHPMQALIFVIFIIVLQQIEGNLIYPKVIGNSVGLPGIWIMLAVTIGGSLMGIVGMLVSVPLCSVLYSVLKTIIEQKLKQKKLVIE